MSDQYRINPPDPDDDDSVLLDSVANRRRADAQTVAIARFLTDPDPWAPLPPTGFATNAQLARIYNEGPQWTVQEAFAIARRCRERYGVSPRQLTEEQAEEFAGELKGEGGAMTVAFERIVTLTRAFDKRSPNPNKNYGVHGVELRMVLRGPLGATQFVVYTNWHLPTVDRSDWPRHMLDPMPTDLGYHSPKPLYEGQTKMDSCDILPGGECYYDGSGLRAEDVFTNTLLTEGSDGVWELLEVEYRDRFESAAEPEKATR